MRHLRFDVASLEIEGVGVPLRAAYLLVAEQEGRDALAWECVAYGSEVAPIAQGRYGTSIVTLDGRTLTGPAIVVRSVDGAHVLRGDGPLDGVDPAELR